MSRLIPGFCGPEREKKCVSRKKWFATFLSTNEEVVLELGCVRGNSFAQHVLPNSISFTKLVRNVTKAGMSMSEFE